MSYKFLGKEISGRFTIPSGIVTTNTKIIEKISREIPQIGIITTKSIGLEPKLGNREPIISQYAPNCFVNAVGLTNPGAREFAKQLQEIKLPKDKFLLVSIFGCDTKEFVEVAKILEPFADAFELNFSCPHAKGYGMALGQDPEIVSEIIVELKKVVKKPLIPKLTPNTNNIGVIAKKCVEAGADAICAINTVGPGYFTHEGIPILSNQKGGMSGKGILPIGLKCVKEISDAVGKNVPIIGCGGISDVSSLKEFEKAGASVFGIGSVLAGMNSIELKKYFEELEKDFLNNTNNSNNLIKKVDMSFKKFVVEKVEKLADDLAVITFDKNFFIRPGQFVFAWLPGFGEKPFSALDNEPLKLLVQKRGCLSEKLFEIKLGEKVYFRGPYGNEVKKDSKKIIIVGGGCGIAALYQLAKEVNSIETEVFFGAKNKEHLFYVEELKKYSTLFVTTDDGSEGEKGFVTTLLENRLKKFSEKELENIVFYNCGPEKMIEAVLVLEEKFVSKKNIFCAIDYVTKCGIGICGSCSTKSGKRICVDGPFINRIEVE